MGSAMVSPGSDCQSNGNQTPSKTGPEEAAGPDNVVAGLGNPFTGSTDTTNSYWGYCWWSSKWERHKENLKKWRSEFGWAYQEESLLAFTKAEEATEETKQQHQRVHCSWCFPSKRREHKKKKIHKRTMIICLGMMPLAQRSWCFPGPKWLIFNKSYQLDERDVCQPESQLQLIFAIPFCD